MTRNEPPERDDEDVWSAATDDVPDPAEVPVEDADTRRGEDRRGGGRRDEEPRHDEARDDEQGDDPGDDTPREDRRSGWGRRTPPEVGSLFDEARRLFGVVRERVVEPLRNDHGDVLDHLSAAGEELMAAYRSAVSRHERRWTAPGARTERVDVDDDADAAGAGAGADRPAGRSRGRGPGREQRGEAVPVEEDDGDAGDDGDDGQPPRR